MPGASSMQTAKQQWPISDDEIRDLMRKIVASPSFFRSARMQRFLYFVVEGTFVGKSRRESLKEGVIAIAVFDRDPAYDPKSDPVVRVEARRLRAKLEQYYDGPGKEEAIRIDIPKGSYVPILRRQGQTAVAIKKVSGTQVRQSVGLALIASVLVTVAVFGGGIDWGVRLFVGMRGAGSHVEIRSLAVLPFRNLSADRAQDYLIEGLTDEITTDLAKIRSLKVISRTSADSYRKTSKRLPEIARELNVDAIVEGTVLGSRNRIRVTAQLIRAATDSHLWADTYERDGDDLFPLQAEIAENIARQIGATVRPASSKTTGGPSIKPKVYNAYLKGRYFWNKRTLGSLERPIDCYYQAIQIDRIMPGHTLAASNIHRWTPWPRIPLSTTAASLTCPLTGRITMHWPELTRN
jgi:TolB-like protein